MSYAGPSTPTGSNAEATPTRQPLIRPAGRQDPIIFAAGLAIGIAIGAGIAMLVAPRSGATTRRRLARRGRRLARRGRDAWSDLRDELADAAAQRRRAKQDRPAAAGD